MFQCRWLSNLFVDLNHLYCSGSGYGFLHALVMLQAAGYFKFWHYRKWLLTCRWPAPSQSPYPQFPWRSWQEITSLVNYMLNSFLNFCLFIFVGVYECVHMYVRVLDMWGGAHTVHVCRLEDNFFRVCSFLPPLNGFWGFILYGALCDCQGQQSVQPHEARRKPSSTWLSRQCRFSLPESDTGQFVVGRFRCSTTWKNISCAQGGIILHWHSSQNTCQFFHEDWRDRLHVLSSA